MTNTSNYASFLKRLGAYIIDSLILSTPFYIWIIYTATSTISNLSSMEGENMDAESMSDPMGGIMIAYLIFFIVYLLYNAYFESSPSGATIGKKLMKINVADTAGNRISFGKAFLRAIGKIISAIILCIGFIMAAFTEKKQALHDMIAGTNVYNNRVETDLNKNM